MNRIFFIIIILLIHFQLDAQTLRSEEAVEITLANNYGILLAKTQLKLLRIIPVNSIPVNCQLSDSTPAQIMA